MQCKSTTPSDEKYKEKNIPTMPKAYKRTHK